jgi:hypothetical protein
MTTKGAEMPKRDSSPAGSPCWADLWTSDVQGSAKFYGELLGWEAQEPSAEFGGYFMFHHNGVPVAGGMGDMGDMLADNSWKIYLTSDDIAKTVDLAERNGAEIHFPPMSIADLGTQTVLSDSTGAIVGSWQPGTFSGFGVLNEPGDPSWFELFTRDFENSISFYKSVFGWEFDIVSDNEQMRYATMRNPEGSAGDWLAGVMDASGFLPDGAPDHWSVYWEVQDANESVEKVKSLGGSVIMDAEDTPYGKLATVLDPFGAQFKLRTSPK